jgi:hypothetical protein
MVIKRVGPLSVAKVVGILYAAIGLLIGAGFSLIAMTGASLFGGREGGGAAALVMGVGAIVIFPVLYGGFGFIGGLIMGALYNVVASMVGGIEVEAV